VCRLLVRVSVVAVLSQITISRSPLSNQSRLACLRTPIADLFGRGKMSQAAEEARRSSESMALAQAQLDHPRALVERAESPRAVARTMRIGNRALKDTMAAVALPNPR
jgi:hypothetical protein